MDICQNAVFSSRGIQYLNARAKTGVDAFRRAFSTGVSDWVQYLDLFSVTRNQCWATSQSDGRHFLPLVPVELAALLTAAQARFAGLPAPKTTQQPKVKKAGKLGSRSGPHN
jgi:hypothetical protein